MLKTITLEIVKEPRLTAKMLCEYKEADVTGRLKILKMAKVKNPVVIAISRRYQVAQEMINSSLCHSINFLEVLKSYALDLRKKSKNCIGRESENLVLCAEALEKFHLMDKELTERFSDFTITKAKHRRGRKLALKGVTVSIRPEILLSEDYGLSSSGFIKLCFYKTKPLPKSVCEGMATLGRLYYKETEKLEFSPNNCFVIDVFANKIYNAITQDGYLLNQLSKCCEEVAEKWDEIDVTL